MVFSSFLFIFVFLPATLLLYHLTPVNRRNWTALAASVVFYAWGAPQFVFILAASCLVDYLVGSRMGDATAGPAPGGERRRRLLLAAGVALNLAFFLYFKYANFLVGEVNRVLHLTGLDPVRWAKVALPIGISFVTFHRISYLVDVYRGTVAPASSLGNYLLYILFFPQLIAGPIIRFHDVAAQLVRRLHTAGKFASGVIRFGEGLAKKVLLANVLGTAADRVFAADPVSCPVPTLWLGALCYSLQIYFDFAGYSDMAIGLGRMFGISFLENFDRPYLSGNFTEFWRRWHISLSNWMREYLYIPLGGNRVRPWRAYLNLWIVFLLSGFWHGASWNFVVWGGWHGLFLTLDKFLGKGRWGRLPRFVAVPLTFLLVTLGWVFFRAPDLSGALRYLAGMTGLAGGAGPFPANLDPGAILTLRGWTMFVLAAILAFAPLPSRITALPVLSSPETLAPRWFALRGSAALILFVLAVSSLATAGFNPFIYFRF